jgi:hypothetical protein
MAVDVITGKPINPNFKGQRTGVDVDFDPTEWQRQWELGEAGDVGAVEATAIQSIKDALAQRHAGNEYYTIDQQGLTDYYAAENARTGGNYVPTAADLTTTGDARLQAEASRIFREQLMGGYNPNIDYRAEGVTPNVFLRSGEGLGGWGAMGRPTTESGPRGVPLGYGVPETQTPVTTQPPTTMGAPAAVPAAAPAAAPAATSTRQATSVTQPAAATAAAAEVDPAIAQREIIEKALAAKLKPIQNALAAGLLDVQAAQLAWDSARSEIYGDFLTEQTGVQQGFQTQQAADEAKRQVGRTKLLQDLNAAGVDSGMVADELALIDAIAEGSGQERMGLIGDMGRIGLMSNADRRMMGEGIFGGYEQDLRSQARQATLGAELDAAGQVQTAEERALSAGRLSDYMGIPVEALMADLYSDIDLTGMATGREGMEWGTSERIGGQEWQTGERVGAQTWQTGERIGGQDWQTAERALDRTFTTGEREAVQEFTSDERVASQDWAHDESIAQRDWAAAEAVLGRTFTTEEREAVEAYNTLERTESQTWQGGESALDRAITQQLADLQTSQLEESIRQFGVGQTNMGIDTRETITLPNGNRVANPAYGRPWGFDSRTGLTAGQTQDQTNWDALFTQGADQWQSTFDQGADQFAAGQLAQGIDTRQTITQPNYQTGAMETVANPGYGRPMGFDAASGLTAGQQGDQAYRDAMLAADETAAATQAEQWQSQFDAGMMGVDTREYVPGPEIGAGGQNVMMRNPMYGMTPSQQAEYTLDLTAMNQAGATETDTFDNLMRYLGQTGDATLTSEVLGKVAEIIATDPGMMTKGPNADTTLYALGVLANTEVENAEGEMTFPYRDIFYAVQNLGGGGGDDWISRYQQRTQNPADTAEPGGITPSGPNVGPAGGAWQGTEEALIDAVADPTAFQPGGDDSWFQPGDWWEGLTSGSAVTVDGVQYTSNAYPEGLTTPEQRERHIRRLLDSGKEWDPLSERWR